MSVTEHGLSTVTDPTDDDGCPGCGATAGGQPQAPATVQAWTCTACGLNWALTVVHPRLRRDPPVARWVLRQIVQLAELADGLTGQQLRHRLITLAECARR